MPEKYYVTSEKHIPGINKKLFGLQGWKQTVAEILLTADLEDSEKKEEIAQVVSDNPESKNESGKETWDDLLAFIGKSHRKKAAVLLHFLKKLIKVNSEGSVVYPNGELGAPLLDTLNYWTNGWVRTEPSDAPQMARLLTAHKVPRSAFARNRDPYLFAANLASQKVSTEQTTKQENKWLNKIPRGQKS
jgi:hypothetical protein